MDRLFKLVTGGVADPRRTIFGGTIIVAAAPEIERTATAMDWHKWHNTYDENPAFKTRLALVRKHLSRCLDRSPPGEVRIISVCAGDGRDILGTLAGHNRRTDVRARLVELDRNLVADGENASQALGLSSRVEFINGDATDLSSYRTVAPANIVVMCGMLGLIDLPELPNVVRAMQALCAHKGHVVWTRRLDWRNGARQTKVLQDLMAQAGFKRATLSVTSFGVLFFKTPRPSFAVGTHRYDGEPVALPESGRLFTISDPFIEQ